MALITSDSRALIIGASGGIGSAMTMTLGNICGMGNVITRSRSADGLDICDEQSIREMVLDLEGQFDLIFIATGALEAAGLPPEKTIMSMTPEALRAQFEINTLGPALLIKHLHAFLPKSRPSVLATLTARVGSIGDNGLGGWISYRTAKSAVHQVIKTAALEIARKRPHSACIALHPGTVQTPLTHKYATQHKSVQPIEAAKNLLSVINMLKPKDNGQFYDWAGKSIEW